MSEQEKDAKDADADGGTRADGAQDGGAETGGAQKGQPKDLDVGEYVESFSALKDSVFLGRDLRKQQRELEDYAKETQAQRETHADQVSILEHFDELVAEQDEIVGSAQETVDDARGELEKASSELAAAQGKLEALKSQHKSELARLKKQNDRTTGDLEKVYAAAKKARREAEDRSKAATQTKEGVGSGQAGHLKQALEEAKKREREANDALDDAKANARQMLRDKKRACDDAEQPLEDQVAKGKREVQRIQGEIDAAERRLSDAQDRIGYCRKVKENPQSVDELAAKIAEREDVERQMRARIDALSEQHAERKTSSKKARIVVVVALVLVVAIVIAIVVAANR